MNKIIILTKCLLKSNSSYSGKKRKIPPMLMNVIGLLILVACLGIPLGMFFASMYDSLKTINQEGVIITLAIASVSMIIFFFAIFYVLTVFYFARDVEVLLPMPLRSYEILTAKFISVLIYEYITEVIVFAPALIVFGIKSQASILYYLYAVILFFIIPILPLVIAAIINMVIMRFTNIGKHKDALKIIGGMIGLLFAIGINLVSQGLGKNADSAEQMKKLLLEGNNSLVGIVSRLFPTSRIGSLALIHSDKLSGLVNLIIFVLISVIIFALFLMLSEKLYFKGALGNSEIYSKRAKLTKEQLHKNIRKNSPIKAYTVKEIKILFRTPAFLMNCIISNFLWPVFMIIGIATSGVKLSQLNMLSGYIQGDKMLGIVVAVAFGLGVFMEGGNGIAATSFSREGQNLYVSKYLPIKFMDNIMARINASLIISALPIIIIYAACFLILKLPTYTILPIIIVTILGMLFMAFAGIIMDIRFPKLDWDNEQKAVKQNLNLLITMFGSWIVAGAIIFAIVKLNFGLWYAFGILAIVFGCLNIALYFFIAKIGEKWFEKINL
ncbi:putative ABC transporter permease subunit [Clostridium oryzae]|uniref:ABC-2 type transport system permease protein n=1 Tax=Clostridium oryzae TaxID=1450648 RepID=A0A1V4IPC5_9CLOT|nr:hypothetical protein [Clostridium oryzae]OPJ61307.1 hypothetical protein CLORY_23470 [Clostridium oryzae]